MKHPPIKIIFLLFLFGLLSLIFFNFFKIFSFPDQNWIIEKENKISLDSGRPIIQKFKAARNNLSKIELLFSQSDKKKIGGKIKIQIAEETCSDILREDFVKVSSISSENTYNFLFSKIHDSKDKTFCLLLNFVPGEESKKTPQVFITDKMVSKNQISLITSSGEELKNQSLAMRPAYKNDNVWQDITELNKRISQYKPWFLKHYYLGFIAFSFIILSIALVVILILI